MPYPEVKTYWLEPTGNAAVGLRRFHHKDDANVCPLPHGYHNAVTYIGIAPIDRATDEYGGHWEEPNFIWPSRSDERWPVRCECGYTFTADDEWQEWSRAQYRRVDTDEVTMLHTAAPGAMWDSWWLGFISSSSADGIALTVKLPNGRDWVVDSRANNCTMPEDNVHRCWVRHGDPRTEPVTVDKNGLTCAAGAGSILSGDYHGFLQNGILTAG